MMVKRIDDCFYREGRESALLSHDCAIAQFKARVAPLTASISLGLTAAQGRICAEDVVAPRQVPGHANAAVDGYAFASGSLQPEGPGKLKIVARVTAGLPIDREIKAGEAVRIFTGAVLPDGCDTIIMQEACEVLDADMPAAFNPTGFVRIAAGVAKGANIRSAGEDIGKGAKLLKTGDVIRPQDIAALASVGLAHVTCFVPPRVAIISSGKEIVRAGATSSLAHGQVYDTNAPMLLALAATAGATATDFGVLADHPETIADTLRDAAGSFDLILTSGGAGHGEEDHIARAIRTCGTCYFRHIAIKPGKPLLFARIGTALIIGLPGNPVAAFVCFVMYVRPLIRRLGGAPWMEPRRFPLPAAFDAARRKTGRREFWRGFIREEAGTLVVEKFVHDGSGLISSLRAADGLIDIHENVSSVRKGDIVNFIPFSEFGLA